MPDALFLAPYVLTYPVGGGRWQLSSVGAVRPGQQNSKCFVYVTVGVDRVSTLVPFGDNGVGKPWCLSLVTASDTVLGAIEADPQIVRLPFGLADLDQPVSTIPPAVRAAVLNRLEAARMPTDWITLDTPIRAVLALIARLVDCARALGTLFPEVDLAQTLGSLTAAQRNALRNWLAANGAVSADLGPQDTVRTALTRLRNVRLGLALRDVEVG